jgi:hypothetical protein
LETIRADIFLLQPYKQGLPVSFPDVNIPDSLFSILLRFYVRRLLASGFPLFLSFLLFSSDNQVTPLSNSLCSLPPSSSIHSLVSLVSLQLLSISFPAGPEIQLDASSCAHLTCN